MDASHGARPTTATAWADRELAAGPDVDPSAARALRVLCAELDAASARNRRQMFAPDVLQWALLGFHPRVLREQLGAPTVACHDYCAQLHVAGLLTRDPRDCDIAAFALPRDAWLAATDADPAERPGCPATFGDSPTDPVSTAMNGASA